MRCEEGWMGWLMDNFYIFRDDISNKKEKDNEISEN
jgi:hypothetical protein